MSDNDLSHVSTRELAELRAAFRKVFPINKDEIWREIINSGKDELIEFVDALHCHAGVQPLIILEEFTIKDELVGTDVEIATILQIREAINNVAQMDWSDEYDLAIHLVKNELRDIIKK